MKAYHLSIFYMNAYDFDNFGMYFNNSQWKPITFNILHIMTFSDNIQVKKNIKGKQLYRNSL